MITNIDDLEVGALVNAEKIKDIPIDDTLIGDKKVLSYDSVNKKLIYVEQTGGGTGMGTVDSVNGKTGVVVITKEDIGLGNTLNVPSYSKSEEDSLLDLKVDKVVGKNLSTNDYTDIEKLKLGSVEEGAEINVQSDWNETSTLSDSFIKNKPTIPNKTSQLSNDSSFVSDSNYVHTDNNLSNALKTAYDLSATNTHTHNNKVILDNIVASGDGSKFLSDDGTYKPLLWGM